MSRRRHCCNNLQRLHPMSLSLLSASPSTVCFVLEREARTRTLAARARQEAQNQNLQTFILKLGITCLTPPPPPLVHPGILRGVRAAAGL